MTTARDNRLDAQLVALGLAPTRSRARDLIVRGFVSVDGHVCLKPARAVDAKAIVALAEDTPGYVSRGAEKLVAALDHFGFDPKGRAALDVGASTGGFTQVLLARGAAHVIAVDVGREQLHDDVRTDPRVTVLEGQDARGLDACLVPEPAAAVVVDVSFIALTKVLGSVLPLAAPGAFLVALVKPQFELEPADVGKGGVVRDCEARARAVEKVRAFIALQSGWRVAGIIRSPILGGSGNEEYLVGAVKDG